MLTAASSFIEISIDLFDSHFRCKISMQTAKADYLQHTEDNDFTVNIRTGAFSVSKKIQGHGEPGRKGGLQRW
ncbi:MAG: hypothetical protein WDO16_06090 [Bacteroidota bacterium]